MSRSVIFRLAEHAIFARGHKATFDVTLTFSDEGECRQHAKRQGSRLMADRTNGS